MKSPNLFCKLSSQARQPNDEIPKQPFTWRRCIFGFISITALLILIISVNNILINFGESSSGLPKSEELVKHQRQSTNDHPGEPKAQFYIVIQPTMPEVPLNPTPSFEGIAQQRVDDFSIYLLTYNVAREDISEDLTDLFGFQRVGVHDMYVITLEEITFSSLYTSDQYMSKLDKIFGERNYVRLKRLRFMITSLSIYVPKDKLHKFHHVKTHSVQTDIMWRKGGIGIRLFYDNMSMAFIGAHLAPHLENYETRIKNYWEIIGAMRFSNKIRDGPLDHDYSFFLGDLNFRIDNLTSMEVYDNIILNENSKNPNKWATLLEYDQLNLARKYEKAFYHFEEANITFPPTYRFIISTDNYDWQKRKPAYTDRILYRNTLRERVNSSDVEKAALHMTHYESLKEYRGSDHKPVRAIARIPQTAFVEKNKWLHVLDRKGIDKRNIASALFTSSDFIDQLNGQSPASGQAVPNAGANMLPHHSRLDRDYHQHRLIRHLVVQFEPIHDWTLDNNYTVYFRVIDSRTNQTVSTDYPGFFQAVSNWDWIGLYRADFCAMDDYVTFAFPHFGDSIEEAEDALELLQGESETGSQPQDQLEQGQESAEPIISSSSSSLSNQFTSSAPFISSTEFGDGQGSVPNPRGITSGASRLFHMKEEEDKSQSSISTSSSSSKSTISSSAKTSSSYVSYEDSTSDKAVKDPSSISSGSGDQTDPDISQSSPSSSPSSQSVSATTSSGVTPSVFAPSDPAQEFSAMFDEQSFLFSNGRYVLIYRRRNGDVLGVSEPFEIKVQPHEELRPESPPN